MLICCSAETSACRPARAAGTEPEIQRRDYRPVRPGGTDTGPRAIDAELPPENDVSSVDALELLGDAAAAQGDARAAEDRYREAIAQNRGGAHAQSADTGQRVLKLARVLALQGRCDEAERSRGEARERAAAVAAANSPGEAAALPGCAPAAR
ncbi:MAG TPA: hypothetical protein VGC30_03275 [Dokdonella sp.]